MWKIKIIYDDKSNITIQGKQKDIPLDLAVRYQCQYVKGEICKATYQQYPKKNYASMDLIKKIEELEACKQN